MRINAVTVPRRQLSDYQRPPAAKLKKYGFEKVLLDYVECPDAIKRTLCDACYLHDIVSA